MIMQYGVTYTIFLLTIYMQYFIQEKNEKDNDALTGWYVWG